MRLILPTRFVPRQSDLYESSIFCVFFFFIYSLSYFDFFLCSGWMPTFRQNPLSCPHISQCQSSNSSSPNIFWELKAFSSYLAYLDFSWRVNACPWLGAPVVLFIGQWKWKSLRSLQFQFLFHSVSQTPTHTHWKTNEKTKCTMDALKLYVIV